MIDKEGYRANVAIVIMNEHGKIFWGKRIRQKSWQFPQGGLNPGETAIEAMYRELHEEVGLKPHDVEILACTRAWLRYRLPRFLIRRSFPLCIGQKQKWFLLKLKSADSSINFKATNKPEFDHWRWVHYWHPINHVVSFKKPVYKKAMEQFFPIFKSWKK
ncbi:RNA pyrophosphohydrolase [Francisellaceae bacterium]|nr:RNA pyrophosphohydrolase [Francisellaceae bacterium]